MFPTPGSVISLVFLFSIVIPLSLVGQTGMVFTKKAGREVLYEVNDEITIRTKEYPKGITRRIKDFDFAAAALIFEDLHVKVKDITHVYVDTKTKNWWFMKHKWGNLLLIVGTGYLAVDGINSGEVSKQTFVFSASCIGAGILAKALISKWIPIGGKKKLKLIRVS